MSTLNKNIQQTIQDFDAIKEAIIEKGVEVPDRTPTSEYEQKIKEIQTGITPTGTVELIENRTHNVDLSEFTDIDNLRHSNPQDLRDVELWNRYFTPVV